MSVWPDRPRLAVVIPALNEEGSLPGVLADLAGALPGARVFVVDNGSTDRTAEVAAGCGAEVVHEPRRGYGSACQAGIARALPAADAVILIDADHADDPFLLPRFVDALRDAELVLSTRTRGGAEPGALSPVQIGGNRLQVAALRARFGLRLTDMGPMRAVRADALRAMAMEDPTWGWNVEMACKAARLRLRVVELPVTYRCRRAGASKISGSWRGATRAGARILWALGRYAR